MSHENQAVRPASTGGDQVPATATTRGPGRLGQVAKAVAPLVGAAVVFFLALSTTDNFLTRSTLALVLLNVGVIGVTALGQMLVLLVGGIDLSIGAVIGLTTVIVASRTDGANAGLPAAVGLALLAGLLVGGVNAGLVLWRKVPPFVATFATFVLVQGLLTAWTKGSPSGLIPPALRPLGSGDFLGVANPAWVFIVIAVLLNLILQRTGFGRRIYATGSNARATSLAGVRINAVIATAYVVSGLLAVLAGLINAGYVGHVDAQLSRQLNLDSIAAAVIGGVALSGGHGTILQTVGGVMLLAVLLVWMVQLGAGAGGQYAIEGAAILLAAALQNTKLFQRT